MSELFWNIIFGALLVVMILPGFVLYRMIFVHHVLLPPDRRAVRLKKRRERKLKEGTPE